MEALDLLHAKLNVARRVLKNFIDNYQGMEDSERSDQARTVLDEVTSYLQIKENLIFPYIRREGEHSDLLERNRAVDEQIEYIIEHAIHMHVDEAGGEFYNRLVQLDNVLDLAIKTDQDTILPWAKVHLSDKDQLYIATHLKSQMVHESLPSSGLTIY